LESEPGKDDIRWLLPATPGRSKDRIVDVGTHQSQTSNLLYSVFVTNIDFDLSTLENNVANVFVEIFRRYKIVLLVNYIKLPSLREGDVQLWSTSTAIENDIKSSDHQQVHATTMPLDYLFEAHGRMMFQLGERFRKRIRQMFPGDLSEDTVFALISTMTLSSAPLIRQPTEKKELT
jgi:hypothetical protein